MTNPMSRRAFLGTSSVLASMSCGAVAAAQPEVEPNHRAHVAITFDLEMSRHYPKRGMTEWDYQKGNLDAATKDYAVRAARIVKDRGGVIHFFCVGRVLEQPDIQWLRDLSKEGHPIGNHTYDHVNVLATDPLATQFRFQRSPWLVEGMSAREIIQSNIELTQRALTQRAGIAESGFRTPGGFSTGLEGREDVQKMLLDLGYRWVSSKYPRHNTGKPRAMPTPDVYASIVNAQQSAQPSVYPSGLVEIPMSPISDVNAFRTNFWKLSYFLKAIDQAVQWAIQTRGVFDFLCHPSCMVVEDPEFETIKLICDRVNEHAPRAKIASLDEIAMRVTSPR